MFSVAILIGIYSYIIFFLGILKTLSKSTVILSTIIYFIAVFYLYRRILTAKIIQYYKVLEKFPKRNYYMKHFRQNVAIGILITILFVQALVNLIGALEPELAFDSLWYHLTLPKIYLENHSIFYIPGGLLYYSAMPKLGEMLYVAALTFDSEILAKIIQFSFGILTLIALYKLSRIFFQIKESLLVLVIFYSNLVVAWQSITAYIDLTRTFYEIMALWAFILFIEKKQNKWLVMCGVTLGFAISTKLLAIGSLFIIALLVFFRSGRNIREIVTNTVFLVSTSLAVSLPWLIFSFLNTWNPVYPFFTEAYKVEFSTQFLNPVRLLNDVWEIFLHADDPLNPIYLISLPLLLILFNKFDFRLKYVGLYSLFALLIWYITPRTGGGRFIMPYLSAFSILVVSTICELREKWLKKYIIGIIFFISLVSIVYRTAANVKYLPVIFGTQTKENFLSNNLNFSFGDFYDTDGFFAKNIKSTDRVLIYGIHNLYYIDFPFIHESWTKKGEKFNYILVQDAELPNRFRNWKLIYKNDKTHVNLFSPKDKRWQVY